MKIDDVRIAGGPLVLAAQADVDALESRLWVAFPEGYRDHVTRLGEGALGSFVRIYPPWRVEKELDEWRRRIKKYWFWDEGRDILPKDRALECVIIGDTMNGDELAFHPSRKDRLYVLPRDEASVFDAGADLPTALEWMCRSGRLVEPIPDPDLVFEPFDSRLEEPSGLPAGVVVDPEGESLDELAELGRRWVQRHASRKEAERELRTLLADLKKRSGKGRKSVKLYEAIVLEGRLPYDTGYLAVYQIQDEASKLEVGVFTWNKGDISYGSHFEPNHANLAKLGESS